MRTTLEINEKLLSEVEKETGIKGKSKAVNKALEEYLYMKAVQKLTALAGHIEFVETWEEMEERELRDMEEHEKERGQWS